MERSADKYRSLNAFRGQKALQAEVSALSGLAYRLPLHVVVDASFPDEVGDVEALVGLTFSENGCAENEK